MFKRRTTIRFNEIDPLGDGLAEAIAAERHPDAGAMTLTDVTPEELSDFWSAVVKDVRNDPTWFSFMEE